jgi:hypothetical protein
METNKTGKKESEESPPKETKQKANRKQTGRRDFIS